MRWLTLSAATLLLSLTAESQVQFGVFTGFQATTANYNVDGIDQETDFKPGFQLGVNMKIPVEGRLSFAPAAYYSLKGYRVTYNRYMYPPSEDATDNNTSFHNFEIAFPLQYDFGYQANHFMIRVGPSLDFQIFGREEFNTTSDGKIKRNIPFGYDKYGHYSANLLFHFGYEMQDNFFIVGQLSYGLANISNTDGGPEIKHQAIGITFGKFIRKSKIVLDTRNRN